MARIVASWFTEDMFDAAIEVAVVTFMTFEFAEVRRALERTGVDAWLSQRLTAYLPSAFGRALFSGKVASMSSTLTDPLGARPLESDPVWIGAVRRASRATRAEMDRIAAPSSTVRSVQELLDKGSTLEKLVLGGLVLDEPLAPMPPARTPRGHGGVPSPREAFLDFLRAHGLAPTEDGQIGGIRVDALVFPSCAGTEVSSQVDFIVSDPRLATGRLVESFAGFGPTWQSALGQTIEKFERGDVHVFIAGLLDRGQCADQVTWEALAHPTGAFDVCLGPLLVLYTNAPGPPLGSLLDAFYCALGAAPLSRTIHGLRLFLWLQNGVLRTVEVLLDNEPWPAGEALANRADWPDRSGSMGVRFFALLIPR